VGSKETSRRVSGLRRSDAGYGRGLRERLAVTPPGFGETGRQRDHSFDARKEIAMKKVFFALGILLIGLTSAAVGSQDFVGVLNDAPYKIRVPDEDWNGVLVLYAHWYYRTSEFPAEAEAAPGGALMEDSLLARGYALAGSNFRGTGWQVKEGTQDLIALSELFDGLVGKPAKRILVGYSAGSLIALKSAEAGPLYDGVIPMCSVVGAPGVDRDGGFAYAYDTVFGWPSDWGTWYDARDGLDFDRDVFPLLYGQLMILGNPGDPRYVETLGKFEFTRLLFDLPLNGFYQVPSQSPDPRPAAVFLMVAATEVKAEIEAKAKGYIYGNAGHVYSLTQDEKDYLFSLGVDADWYLTSMNEGTNISPANPQRQYGEKYFDPTGDLRVPVLSVHSINDHIYPAYFETRLLNKVQSAGREDRFLQVYTDGFGHCTFTPEQLLAAIRAMESWLDTGTKPDPNPSQELSPFHDIAGFLNPATIDPAIFVWPIGTK